MRHEAHDNEKQSSAEEVYFDVRYWVEADEQEATQIRPKRGPG